MIERVARAIDPDLWIVLDKLPEGCKATTFAETWESPRYHVPTLLKKRDISLKKARAAIGAVREPTEAMRDAGVGSGACASSDLQPAEPETIWTAMIDAAVKGAE